MAAFTMEDLLGCLPWQKLTEALDDDGDGIADDAVFEAVLGAALDRARAAFGGEPPARHEAAARRAARVFLLDLLYRRRGVADEANPWARQAAEEEERLRALATGAEAVDATEDGVVIAKPAKIYGSTGVLS